MESKKKLRGIVMKKILVMDEKNYTDEMPIFEKNAVRAIIQKGNLIAMQRGNNGVYKIPGGAVECAESHQDALIREVVEETGLIVIPETISEIGEIEEIREDCFCAGQKYISHSYFYSCRVKDETMQTNMTENEIEKGYQLQWVTAKEIYDNNAHLVKEPWMKRDINFIKMIIDGSILL